MKVIKILAGIFAIGLISTNASAEDWVYKWVDAEGVTHYESRPPEWAGAEITSVRVKRSQWLPLAHMRNQNT